MKKSRLKNYVRRLWRKLDLRLMLLICMTVIPVNIIAIILSGITVSEAKARTTAAYENEFNLFMERELTLLEKLDEWYVEFIQKYMGQLTNPQIFSAVDSISIFNEITSAMNMYDINGFFFLEEKQEDMRLYVKGTKNLYTQDEIDQIKFSILTENLPLLKWRLQEIGGHPCYFVGYSYLNYNLGFGIDLNVQLQSWLSDASIIYGQILLEDEYQAIIADSHNGTEMISLSEAEKKLKSWQQSNSILGFLSDRQKNIHVWLIGDSSQISLPLPYIFLQILAWFSLLILLALWAVIRRQVICPLKILENGMKMLDDQQWQYRIISSATTDDFEFIYSEFNKMASDILKSHENDILLYQVQLNNLKLQVNPHMLQNSLTMIYSLAQTKQYPIIQKFTMHLVSYFRYCLKEGADLVTVTQEMNFVENYMEIQKIRYPGELSCVYNVAEGTERALIPPLMIQNFVENCVKYARIPEKQIEILINIRRSDSRLFISVTDTGKGMDESILEYLNTGKSYTDKSGLTHIGIYNCRRRLETFYEYDASLKIISHRGSGTQVWLDIPYQKKEEKNNEFADCR